MRRKKNGGNAGQYEGQQSSALRKINAAGLMASRMIARHDHGASHAQGRHGGEGSNGKSEWVTVWMG